LFIVDEEKKDPLYGLNANKMTARVLSELSTTNPTVELSGEVTPAGSTISAAKKYGSSADLPDNAAHFSTGRMAASFTSTSMAPVTINERVLIEEDEFMYKKIKDKGYAQIKTNLGDINVELHCNIVSARLIVVFHLCLVYLQ
jgi:peptidyl-prolyl cis-trans isomerase-like protein 2